MNIENITILGFTEPHILMISEILLSKNILPKLQIYDNQKRVSSPIDYIENEIEFVSDIENLNNYIFCLSKPLGKKYFVEKYNLSESKFISLLHKTSEISPFSNYKNGLRVEPFSYIGPKTEIGKYVNINRGCVIGHHNRIGNYSTLNPSVKTAGYVTIGDMTEIGIGTTIINNINIGNNSIIGAGSVVTKDIPDNVVAYGNPCKIIRKNL